MNFSPKYRPVLSNALVVLAASVALLVPTTAASAATYMGTEGPDKMKSVDDVQRDFIYALGGNDVVDYHYDLKGMVSMELVDAGSGNDRINFNGSSSGRFLGGEGNDVLTESYIGGREKHAWGPATADCGPGMDLYVSLRGANSDSSTRATPYNCEGSIYTYEWVAPSTSVKFGTSGADRLNGGTGSEVLVGGAGNDLLFSSTSSAGIDYALGGEGDDVIDSGIYLGANGWSTGEIDAGPGNDVVILRKPGSNTICGAGYDLVYRSPAAKASANIQPDCEEIIDV